MTKLKKRYIIPVSGATCIWIVTFLFNLNTTAIETKVKVAEHSKEHVAVNEKIDNLEHHISERFEDLKDFLRNGSQ